MLVTPVMRGMRKTNTRSQKQRPDDSLRAVRRLCVVFSFHAVVMPACEWLPDVIDQFAVNIEIEDGEEQSVQDRGSCQNFTQYFFHGNLQSSACKWRSFFLLRNTDDLPAGQNYQLESSSKSSSVGSSGSSRMTVVI